MIVIFSYPNEVNTNKIIEWLVRFNCTFKRIHLEEEDFRNITLKLNKEKCKICLDLKDGSQLDFDTVSYFLYRGGRFPENYSSDATSILPKELMNLHLEIEYKGLVEFFYQEVRKKCIGWISNLLLNKIYQLNLARSLGITIPNSIIVNTDTEDLTDHFITKGIQESVVFQTEELLYLQRVHKIDKKTLSGVFFPSLFQEIVNKKFEIRSFYLEGNFYSIAVLNESNDKNIDTRANTDSNINIPYQLPIELEQKLRALMHQLNLVSGSIDLLCDENGEFYFLEVNPEGQYDWVSVFGNYQLHKKIAHFLATQNQVFYETEKS